MQGTVGTDLSADQAKGLERQANTTAGSPGFTPRALAGPGGENMAASEKNRA